MPSALEPEAIDAIVGGYHGAPFDVLGMHAVQADGTGGVVVRAFLPEAKSASVWAEGKGKPVEMEQVHPHGFFEAVLPGRTGPFPYKFRITPHHGEPFEREDPYRFPPVLSDFDLHLFGEGNHQNLYDKFGAHWITHAGVAGVNFAVWAPNAERVSVIGDFNAWDGRRHPMRPRGGSGVWELFIPELGEGTLYKYEIKTRSMGYVAVKSDPFGFYSELRPKTASVVYDVDRHAWGDSEWMSRRREHNRPDSPVSVYEVHLGSWRRVPDEGLRFLTYRELADTLVPYAKALGHTHLELLPVSEHPLDGSWGYQTTGYFAPTSRFGTPGDFQYFVDRAHQAGLAVIIDWVPAHFPKDSHGLAFFDGTHLYEHADPRKGEHQDWGTLIFNFDRTEVREFLFNNALFWLDKYHIDGLRVDAVASMLYLDYSRSEGEWIPNEYGGRENLGAVSFIKRFNELVHQEYPDVLTFAEESTAWPMVSRPTYLGGLGFDLKWNMGWMHDMLSYMQHDPIYRRYHHHTLTFSLLYAFTENFILPLSHDEVVHGKKALLAKMPGDVWQQFANLRALYGYMFAHPGKKLLFMGGELGQWNEWNSDQGLDWNLLEYDPHRGIHKLVADLNAVYQREPALHQVDFGWEGFEWIDINDVDNSIVSFVRRGKDPDELLVVAANFTPVPRMGYRLGVPKPGKYAEVLNTDSTYYGGANIGNGLGVLAEPTPWQGKPHSLVLTVPPLGVVYLKPVASDQ